MISWWKILGALLLFGVILTGLLVPLSAGIDKLSAEQVEYNQPLSFSAETYNTHLEANKSTLKAWLVGEHDTIDLPQASITSDQSFAVSMETPAYHSNNYDLFVYDEQDGTFILTNALFVKGMPAADSLVQPVAAHTPVVFKKPAAFGFPNRALLKETIRNLFFHVPMWFGMIFLLIASMVHAILFLSKGRMESDIASAQYANAGILFGVVGLLTGMVWAQHTWGTPWTNDPKLNSAAIGMLIYFAYLVLRRSIEDEEKRARVSAVYNIFSLPIFLVLVFVLPRINDSLHPGNGGNPGFNTYDLDNRMRMVFYPAIIGWTLIGFWIADLGTRSQKLIYQKQNES